MVYTGWELTANIRANVTESLTIPKTWLHSAAGFQLQAQYLTSYCGSKPRRDEKGDASSQWGFLSHQWGANMRAISLEVSQRLHIEPLKNGTRDNVDKAE